MSAEAICEALVAQFPRLKERRRQIAGTLSGGEQQMLAASDEVKKAYLGG